MQINSEKLENVLEELQANNGFYSIGWDSLAHDIIAFDKRKQELGMHKEDNTKEQIAKTLAETYRLDVISLLDKYEMKVGK